MDSTGNIAIFYNTTMFAVVFSMLCSSELSSAGTEVIVFVDFGLKENYKRYLYLQVIQYFC